MPDFVDVSKIVLTDAELAVFDHLSQTDPFEIPRSVYISLYRKQLVRGGSLGWFWDTPPETVSCLLTPLGVDLAAFRALAAEQLAADQEKEAMRLKERHEDIARGERYHVDDKKTAYRTAFLSAALSFIAGLLVQYFTDIVGFVISLFH